jgi:hypothetical protein
VRHAIGKIDCGKRLLRHLMTFRARNTAVDQWQFDIVQRRRARQEVERLKHEADLLIANAGQLVVIHFRNVFAVQPVLALRRRVETSDQVHQRGLA